MGGKMTIAIQKLIKRIGIVKKLSCSGFINPDGAYIPCIIGADHVTTCKAAKTSLNAYLKAGGVRVFNHNREVAIEHWEPLTDEQVQSIINLARWNVMGTITINTTTKQKDGGYYSLRSMGNAVRGLLLVKKI